MSVNLEDKVTERLRGMRDIYRREIANTEAILADRKRVLEAERAHLESAAVDYANALRTFCATSERLEQQKADLAALERELGATTPTTTTEGQQT